MRCSYCFYRDTADRRAVRAVLMSVDTLRETVREAVLGHGLADGAQVAA